jgi:hypothetical protein
MAIRVAAWQLAGRILVSATVSPKRRADRARIWLNASSRLRRRRSRRGRSGASRRLEWPAARDAVRRSSAIPDLTAGARGFPSSRCPRALRDAYARVVSEKGPRFSTQSRPLEGIDSEGIDQKGPIPRPGFANGTIAKKNWAVLAHGPSLGRKRLEDVRQAIGQRPCRTAEYALLQRTTQAQNRTCNRINSCGKMALYWP